MYVYISLMAISQTVHNLQGYNSQAHIPHRGGDRGNDVLARDTAITFHKSWPPWYVYIKQVGLSVNSNSGAMVVDHDMRNVYFGFSCYLGKMRQIPGQYGCRLTSGKIHALGCFLYWSFSCNTRVINSSTPKSDEFQISPAASPEILHHTVWRTWLFIAILIWKIIMYCLNSLTTSPIHFSIKVSELRGDQGQVQ